MTGHGKAEHLCQAAIILIPAAIIGYWALASGAAIRTDWLAGMPAGGAILGWKRAACAVFTLFCTAPLLLGLVQLQAILHFMRRGAWFDDAMMRAVPALGQALIGYAALSLLCQPAVSVLLTCDAPAGRRLIALSLGQADLLPWLAGALALVMARLLLAGRALADDQKYMV
jgi:hypothetical protein